MGRAALAPYVAPGLAAKKARKADIAAVERLVREQVATVQGLAAPALRALLPALMDARNELRAGLQQWLATAKDGNQRFTAQQRMVALRSLDAALDAADRLEPAMAKSLGYVRDEAGPMSISMLETEIARLGSVFGESITAPQFDTAAVLARGDRLLFKRHENSAARYAGTVGEDIRHQLAVGVARGETFAQLTARLRKMGGPRGLVSLRGKLGDPGSVSEDIAEGLFRRYHHWAERIVRTELMEAYNLQHDLALDAVNENRPEGDEAYLRRWDASADRRVCPICRDLDSRVASLEGTFPSGFKYPPAHPRCRCVLLAWHARWGNIKGEIPVVGEVPSGPKKAAPAPPKPAPGPSPEKPAEPVKPAKPLTAPSKSIERTAAAAQAQAAAAAEAARLKAAEDARAREGAAARAAAEKAEAERVAAEARRKLEDEARARAAAAKAAEEQRLAEERARAESEAKRRAEEQERQRRELEVRKAAEKAAAEKASAAAKPIAISTLQTGDLTDEERKRWFSLSVDQRWGDRAALEQLAIERLSAADQALYHAQAEDRRRVREEEQLAAIRRRAEEADKAKAETTRAAAAAAAKEIAEAKSRVADLRKAGKEPSAPFIDALARDVPSSLRAPLRDAILVEGGLPPPTRGGSFSVMPQKPGVEGVNRWDGSVEVSPVAWANAKSFGRMMASSTERERLMLEMAADTLAAAAKAKAAGNRDEYNRILASRRRFQDAAAGAKTVIHEEYHSFGPIARPNYKDHGAFVEEVTTEISAQRYMRKELGLPLKFVSDEAVIDGQHYANYAYGRQVSGTLSAVEKAYSVSRTEAWGMVEDASIAFKARGPNTVTKESAMADFASHFPEKGRSELVRALEGAFSLAPL